MFVCVCLVLHAIIVVQSHVKIRSMYDVTKHTIKHQVVVYSCVCVLLGKVVKCMYTQICVGVLTLCSISPSDAGICLDMTVHCVRDVFSLTWQLTGERDKWILTP